MEEHSQKIKKKEKKKERKLESSRIITKNSLFLSCSVGLVTFESD